MNTGRNITPTEEILTPPTFIEGSLEAKGYAIKSSPRGGGFLLYKIGETELEPIDTIKETDKWMKETSASINISIDLLKKSYLKEKNRPKKTSVNETTKVSTTTFEILTSKLNQVAPDSGVIGDRAYLGFWLPARVQEADGLKVRKIFHLLFNDGELVPADPETLSSKEIYLRSDPVHTDLKISIDTILNLTDLPTVNSAKILFALIEQLQKYVEFDDKRFYSFVAYWIIATYFHKRFGSFPYLFINAVKSSGKTKLLDTIKLLAYNAVFSPNMSTSALFRLIQSAGATVLLDESEDLNDPEKKADFKSLLLSGYKRGSFVYRSEEQDKKFVPVPYDVYSPKAIANINGINDVLESRCIPITMKRGRTLSIINKEIPSEDPIWETIRDELSRMYYQDFASIESIYKQMENVDQLFEGINVDSVVSVDCVGYLRVQEKKTLYVARTWELWRPIFAVAKHILIFFSSSLDASTLTTQTTLTTQYIKPFEDILTLSADLLTEKEQEGNTDSGESLLIMGLLRAVTKDAYYSPTQILYATDEFQDQRPGWFNQKWLGHVFKRLGFKDKRRHGKGVEYHLTPAQVQDMADRLNIHLPDELVKAQWYADMEIYWQQWLKTVVKMDQCHNFIGHDKVASDYAGIEVMRTIPIPWVNPETEFFRKEEIWSVEVKESNELHFHKLLPNEIHKCDACKGLEAVFQQDKYYFCRGCFVSAGRRAATDGVTLIEDRQECNGEERDYEST
jgi:hypothetical protein